MNKNSVLRFVGKASEHNYDYTEKKIYHVYAGYGDGVPRNNGTFGAYIKNRNTAVIIDDRGSYRTINVNNPIWKIVHESGTESWTKPSNGKDPIPVSKAL